MDIKLTKDSDTLICLLYKQYCEQCKNGVSKSAAKIFGSSEEIQETIIPEWSPENVDETCRELGRAKLLDCFYADDIAYLVQLSDNGIYYMENRFKNGLNEVLNYLNSIRSLFPF